MHKLFFVLCSILTIYHTKQSQIPYQVLNQTMSDSSLQFYGPAGDTINITVQFNIEVNFTFYLFKINDTDNFLSRSIIYVRSLTQKLWIETSMKFNQTALYLVFILIYDERLLLFNMKMQAEINSLVIIQRYETVMRTFGPQSINVAIYQFQTLSLCKTKIYWNGPNVTINVYRPFVYILGNPIFSTPAQNGTQFELNLNQTGKWNLLVLNNYYEWDNTKRGIVNFTTFTQAKCIHSCSKYNYPVVGLAPGTADQCICDFQIRNSVWDPRKKVCNLCDHGVCVPICKNGKRQYWQQCDNGEEVGCTNECKPEIGFNCTGQIGFKSVCNSTCGDGIKASNEKCDSAGEIGCQNGCKPDLGFSCTGKIGQKSVCNIVCGDGIRAPNEECDTAGVIGCRNGCKPDQGFNCSGEVGQKSLCIFLGQSSSLYMYIGIGGGILAAIILIIFFIFLFKRLKATSALSNLNTVPLPKKDLNIELKTNKKNEIKNKTQTKQTTLENILQANNNILVQNKLQKRKDKQNSQTKRQNVIDPDTQCCICLMGQCDVQLPCKHYFHRKCIFQWLKYEKCPLCRKDPLQQSYIGLKHLG